jgi:hypothetical protein
MGMEKGDEEGVAEALSHMTDSLYNSVRGLSGGSGAKAYMDLLSATCLNPSGDLAKQLVTKIAPQLRFPVRFYEDGRKRFTFVWGSQENNFYTAWQQQQALFNTENEFLPINSKERFVLLTVSHPFTRKDIRGIAAGTPKDNEELEMRDEG